MWFRRLSDRVALKPWWCRHLVPILVSSSLLVCVYTVYHQPIISQIEQQQQDSEQLTNKLVIIEAQLASRPSLDMLALDLQLISKDVALNTITADLNITNLTAEIVQTLSQRNIELNTLEYLTTYREQEFMVSCWKVVLTTNYQALIKLLDTWSAPNKVYVVDEWQLYSQHGKLELSAKLNIYQRAVLS